ncbi:MAG: metallophosphoesterase [Hyphomonadaceae bacterium]
MIRHLTLSLALFWVALAPQLAAAQQWDNVDRVVAIGDLEGDIDKFRDMLRQAGLINAQDNWSGGRAHLVQLGDVPDRGAHSRAIMDLLMRLEPQAERAGGRVHALIGNHEAMNVTGDLRYVHPGEYEAFRDRRSQRTRQDYYRQTLDYLRANPPPEGLPEFDDAFRQQWEALHPLGYVEHRRAWQPGGRYGDWIASHDSVIRINDTLFVHGGIGPAFAAYEAAVMNEAVDAALRGQPDAGDPNLGGILTHQEGPLWYRGLAMNDEAAETANLEAVLTHFGVRRIVTGHTKLAATVLPRFDGRVIVTDIAVPDGHSDPHAFLIIEGDQLTTMHRGQRVPLNAATPEARCAYLSAVVALDPPQTPLQRQLAACAAPAATP